MVAILYSEWRWNECLSKQTFLEQRKRIEMNIFFTRHKHHHLDERKVWKRDEKSTISLSSFFTPFFFRFKMHIHIHMHVYTYIPLYVFAVRIRDKEEERRRSTQGMIMLMDLLFSRCFCSSIPHISHLLSRDFYTCTQTHLSVVGFCKIKRKRKSGSNDQRTPVMTSQQQSYQLSCVDV